MPGQDEFAPLKGKHIAIEGPLGVGKTSLAERIAKRLDASVRLEEVEENPFLRDYYKQMGRMAFQTQMYFLLSRWRQCQDLKQADLFRGTVITDYLFDKDRVFAALTLTEHEYGLYEKIYAILKENIRTPDLVLFLQAPTDLLMKRIRTRGREFERDIEPEYLEAVNKAFGTFTYQFDGCPVLIVDTSRVDLAHHEVEVEDVLRAMMRVRGGKSFYNPAALMGES